MKPLVFSLSDPPPPPDPIDFARAARRARARRDRPEKSAPSTLYRAALAGRGDPRGGAPASPAYTPTL